MQSQHPTDQSDCWRQYTDLRRTLRALGDEVRLNIVHVLAEGNEVKVTELAERLVVSQPLVSWHLTILRRVELVQTRRQGREVYCSLDVARYKRCLDLLAEVVSVSAPSERRGEEPRVPARGGRNLP